ncbi:MAG: MaoC family dehydratase N-terminal domain-containing protein [Candidatus Rokubacteria bacterium]|nr:MaoC family dehydratase N-terminal domain-containing protein [Candidatus Rokubacteria bacterium]
MQINKDVKGKEYPPFAVTVERGKIKEFARAIGDLNPFYLDDRVGGASEFGDRKSGPMAFVVRETSVTDRSNEIVVRIRHTTVVRL